MRYREVNMKTEIFNINRFGLLFRRQFLLHSNSWIIALISVAGSIIFFAFMSLLMGRNDGWLSVFNVFGVIAFFVTGLVFASLSFSEMGTYTRSLQFVTLPASRLEKFLAAWLMTSVFYFVAATIMLVVSSAFVGMLSVLIFKGNFMMFQPFTLKYGETALAYFIAHSIFFLGATWFRKAAFFKTLLTMFVVNIITQVWWFLWIVIIINPFRLVANKDNLYLPFDQFSIMEPMIKNTLIGSFVTLAVIFLITAWIRFKEREV
jgi:hypothetical protein